MSKNGNTSPLFKILERKRVLHIDLLTFVQIVNNLALEPYSKLCSFHTLFVNGNVCLISMCFEEANCAWNN